MCEGEQHTVVTSSNDTDGRKCRHLGAMCTADTTDVLPRGDSARLRVSQGHAAADPAKGIRRTGPYFEKKNGKFGRLTPATEREHASFHRNAGPFHIKLINIFS